MKKTESFKKKLDFNTESMKKLFIKAAVLIGVTLGTVSAKAQDGQALFKSKCNTCHLLDKASTGPLLKGVKQKWTDAGEADLLYQWVQNSTGLIGTGKSKMANANCIGNLHYPLIFDGKE